MFEMKTIFHTFHPLLDQSNSTAGLLIHFYITSDRDAASKPAFTVPSTISPLQIHGSVEEGALREGLFMSEHGVRSFPEGGF